MLSASLFEMLRSFRTGTEFGGVEVVGDRSSEVCRARLTKNIWENGRWQRFTDGERLYAVAENNTICFLKLTSVTRRAKFLLPSGS